MRERERERKVGDRLVTRAAAAEAVSDKPTAQVTKQQQQHRRQQLWQHQSKRAAPRLNHPNRRSDSLLIFLSFPLCWEDQQRPERELGSDTVLYSGRRTFFVE